MRRLVGVVTQVMPTRASARSRRKSRSKFPTTNAKSRGPSDRLRATSRLRRPRNSVEADSIGHRDTACREAWEPRDSRALSVDRKAWRGSWRITMAVTSACQRGLAGSESSRAGGAAPSRRSAAKLWVVGWRVAVRWSPERCFGAVSHGHFVSSGNRAASGQRRRQRGWDPADSSASHTGSAGTRWTARQGRQTIRTNPVHKRSEALLEAPRSAAATRGPCIATPPIATTWNPTARKHRPQRRQSAPCLNPVCRRRSPFSPLLLPVVEAAVRQTRRALTPRHLFRRLRLLRRTAPVLGRRPHLLRPPAPIRTPASCRSSWSSCWLFRQRSKWRQERYLCECPSVRQSASLRRLPLGRG